MPPQETKLNANMTVDTTPQQLADFTAKFKALSANPTYPTAINSSVMSSTPVKIPDTTYQPTTGNLSTAVNTTQANATATGSAAPITDDKSQLNTYLKGIIENTGKQADAVAQIQQDEDRAKKKERALQLENEITAMDKAYRDEVTAIKENPQGKLASGIQDEVNRATDRYQNNRANASIAYNTALGAYNVANDIVNQKVQALKDQNTQAMNAYSLLKDSIYNDLTESEKLQIQANLNKQKSQADLIESAYTSALSSAAKNGAPASVLAAIDTASKAPNATAASILAAAGGYLSDGTATDVKTQVVETPDGKKILINSQTGETIKEIGGTGATTQDTQALQTANTISNIVSDPSFDKTFGLLNYGRRAIAGTQEYALKAQVENLIADLSLAARGQLKGQGQVSNYEGELLARAQTALKLNMTPTQARKELTQVKGAIRTSSGLDANVKLTDPKTKQTQIVKSNQAGITQAIKDGLQVEYTE